MWAYLEATGVLEHGTDAEIKAAKRAYKKQYFLKYRRERRLDRPEFSVPLSRKKGELDRITIAARRHHMTVTRFLREATLAYLERRYLKLMPHRIAQLEQILSDCLNEVSAISQVKEKYSFSREEKYDAIAARIQKLEDQLNELFQYPTLLEEAVAEAIKGDPEFRVRLLTIVSHDHQD